MTQSPNAATKPSISSSVNFVGALKRYATAQTTLKLIVKSNALYEQLSDELIVFLQCWRCCIDGAGSDASTGSSLLTMIPLSQCAVHNGTRTEGSCVGDNA